MQNLYSENRNEKKELLDGLTLVHNETPLVSPLEQVRSSPLIKYLKAARS